MCNYYDFSSMDQIENLLQLIHNIQSKHSGNISKTGLNFNIFEIIGLTTEEVRVHSAFIANLLNPKGTHNQNSKFLELFIKRFGCSNIDIKKTSVECEKYIGRKTDDTGGRLDIVISDCSNTIIIENKIYASDQHNQLVRYHKYDEKALLLYLTLDGREPSKDSKRDLTSGDYKCISYATDILTWLEECQDSVKDISVIYEAIGQYIVLIKNLTNQSIYIQMSQEIIKTIFGSQENIMAALEIVKTWNSKETKEYARRLFWQYLKDQLIKRFKKIDIKQCDRNKGKDKLYGLDILLYETDEVKFYWRVEAEFNVYFGIVIKNKEGEYITSSDKHFEGYRKLLKDKFENWNENSDYFLYWGYPNGQQISYKDFNDTRFLLLTDDNKLVSAIADDLSFVMDTFGDIHK